MFNHNHYVPILKWKMGEYQALERLAEPIKERITPLLEIPLIGFDYEAKQDKKTIDDHLARFGVQLKTKWGARRCFIDLMHFNPAARMKNGAHPVDFLLSAARTAGCNGVPVVALRSDVPFVAAVAAVVAQDRAGVCLRLVLRDFDRADLSTDIAELLRKISLGYGDVDLLLDLATPNYVPVAAYTRFLSLYMSMIPQLNRWRSLTICGTSYPESGVTIVSPLVRHEWLSYVNYTSSLSSTERIPSFGDYAVAHPALVELDMRMVKPVAKLRYTYKDHWHVDRGTNVRTNGFSQYVGMCKNLVGRPYFDGAAYSAADQYIADCASGKASTGNLSTWVWVSTNRHLTKVVTDLSSLHVP